MERVPRRRGRRFPDNRSHLCQVVEPEGFPSRHGDEVTIRYFLLLGQQRQRGSAVVAIVGKRRRMTRRKRGEKSERSDRGGRGRKGIEASRWRERERHGNRYAMERERERRAAKEREMEEGGGQEERGRRQVEEEKSVTVLYLSLGPASSFQGSRTPVDRAEFEGRCSSFSGYEPREFQKWHNYRAQPIAPSAIYSPAAVFRKTLSGVGSMGFYSDSISLSLSISVRFGHRDVCLIGWGDGSLNLACLLACFRSLRILFILLFPRGISMARGKWVFWITMLFLFLFPLFFWCFQISFFYFYL